MKELLKEFDALEKRLFEVNAQQREIMERVKNITHDFMALTYKVKEETKQLEG